MNGLETILDMIDEPNRSACRKLYHDNKEIFDAAKGSRSNHQWWDGGYADHIREVSAIARMLYSQMDGKRPLPFTLSDAVLVLFLHDLEKPWKYGRPQTPIADGEQFKEGKISEYGILLDPRHLNALAYVHGELNDYSGDRRVQAPLAAFVHCCDTLSARVWYDEPKKSGPL